MDPRATSLLEYWFGRLDDDGLPPDDRYTMWFGGNPEVDEQLREAFGELPIEAANGSLDDWADEPRGRLALILVEDQLPRNLFRGDARAFDLDETALRVTLEGLELGDDRAIQPVERLFFYLPLEHAEDLALQDQCVKLCEALEAEAPETGRRMFAAFTDYARRHREVIARFGRFPHRNKTLGRANTAEEAAFLLEHGGGF